MMTRHYMTPTLYSMNTQETERSMTLRIKTKSIVLGLSLVLAAPLAIADTFNATQVETLRKQGKAQQAYELALKYRDQFEGAPGFDYAYGLAAIDAGQISEGLLALDRVVLTNPNHVRARAELARGYFLLKEDTRARQEFELVLAKKPPADVAVNVKRFLKIIRSRESEYKSTGSGYIEVAIGHDTNISNATADSSFFSPLFNSNINLASTALEDSDDYITVTTGGKLVHPFEPGKQLVLGVDVSAKFNSNDDNFETEIWNIYAGVNWQKGNDKFSIKGQVQEFEVGDIDNRSLIGLTGEWNRQLNKSTNWESLLQIAQLGYPGQSIRDSTLYNLSTGLSYQSEMKWRPRVIGGLFIGYEGAHASTDAARATAERNFAGLKTGLQVFPTSKLMLATILRYETSNYREENIFVGKTRNDNFYQASLTGRYLVDDNWSLGAGLYYTRNDSNTSILDYDRTRAQVSARYTF